MSSMNTKRARERGIIDIKIFSIVLLSILFMTVGSLSIWLYFQYDDAKTDVDAKVTEAVGAAKLEEKKKNEEEFIAREKEPNRTFAGPDDYGHLTFDYPKTWNAYQDTDVSGGGGATYTAYLHSGIIPPVPVNAAEDLIANTKPTPSQKIVSKYALRVKIKQKLYDDTLKEYDPLLKTGQIKSQAFTNDNGVVGTRFEGRFNNDIRGIALVIRMRDRTLTMRTDADVFAEDFDKLAKTIKFNQ